MAENLPLPTQPPTRRKRWPKILGLIAATGVVLLVVLYFVVSSSGFFTSVILPRVGKAMNATITVSEASIHPFSEVYLKDLKVQTVGDTPLATVAEMRARYHLMDILRGNLNVEEVTVNSPVLTLIQNADGTSNLDPITKSQKSGASDGGKPKPDDKGGSAPKVDLKKFSLVDATLRYVNNHANGKKDLTEISKLNVSLTDVKNGQSGKMTVGADFKAEINPTNNPAGSAQASLKGNYDFTFTQELRPSVVKGNSHFEVTRAEGGLADLASLAADLDAELSPTEIKQVALRFQKGTTRLGEVRVAGPFDAQKGEGRISVDVSGLDRRALNLAGAPKGIDFGTTTISATNLIEITKNGGSLVANGQLLVNKFQTLKDGQTTPTVDVAARYHVTADQSQQLTVVDSTTLAIKIDSKPPIEAQLRVELAQRKQVIDLRHVILALTPTARAKNELDLTGQLDLSAPDALQGNLKLASDGLDLTAYYDAMENSKSAATSGTASTPTQKTGAADGSAKEPEAMKLPVKSLTTDVTIARILLREIDIADFRFPTKIEAQQISTSMGFSLNQAPVKLATTADLSVPGFKYDLSADATSVPLAPIVNSMKPERKGQLGGTLTASTKLNGAGCTPANYTKSLAGQFDVVSTNLNLSTGNVENPILKVLVTVISQIPELIKNPGAGLGALAGSVLGKVTGTPNAGGSEISKSPINSILARGTIKSGQVALERALVQSANFEAGLSGTVGLTDPITNSTLQLPVMVSLERSVAQSLKLAPAGATNQTAFFKIPDFLSIKGTVGIPKADVNGKALLVGALEGLGNVPGLDAKSGGLIKDVGNLLKGGGGSTNSTGGTNTSPAKGLLDNILKPKPK